ncbi:hypothetical protein NH399_12490 [Pleionea sp. CnH1-48]|nr:hypothetical protein [Pleionea sp. CnH1-48]
MRKSLSRLPELKMERSVWRNVQVEHQMQSSVKEVRVWRHLTSALAASILALVSFLVINEFKDSHSELDSLVSENQQMYALIERLRSSEQFEYKVSVKLSQIQLDEIDLKIQKAYLDSKSDKVKTELWKERKLILQNMLSQHLEKKSLSI